MAAGELKESIALSKKTAERQREPNRRLKYERELRGWSQKYVATRINAERYYVSRWETGAASPRPDYRRKLCELFEKSPQELGFIREGIDEESNSTSLGTLLWPLLFLMSPIIPC